MNDKFGQYIIQALSGSIVLHMYAYQASFEFSGLQM